MPPSDKYREIRQKWDIHAASVFLVSFYPFTVLPRSSGIPCQMLTEFSKSRRQKVEVHFNKGPISLAIFFWIDTNICVIVLFVFSWLFLEGAISFNEISGDIFQLPIIQISVMCAVFRATSLSYLIHTFRIFSESENRSVYTVVSVWWRSACLF